MSEERMGEEKMSEEKISEERSGEDKIRVEFGCNSENESFARVVASVFAARLNPTIEEVEDIKTAVSEAVTNSIIHGYVNGNDKDIISMECSITGHELEIIISDNGIGIYDVKKAREPLFTTKPDEERSGMGFSFMEIFMDSLEVVSTPMRGTMVKMTKLIGKSEQQV